VAKRWQEMTAKSMNLSLIKITFALGKKYKCNIILIIK
jgi:hypothetical protein